MNAALESSRFFPFDSRTLHKTISLPRQDDSLILGQGE